jgi:hypothetical protein
MNKIFHYTIFVAVLLGIVIVDTIADPAMETSFGLNSSFQISPDQNINFQVANRSVNSEENIAKNNSSSALFSLLLVGFTLVGLANFRSNSSNGKSKANSNRSKIVNSR